MSLSTKTKTNTISKLKTTNITNVSFCVHFSFPLQNYVLMRTFIYSIVADTFDYVTFLNKNLFQKAGYMELDYICMEANKYLPMKRFINLILFVISPVAMAQNPIISGQFTADPTARVFDNKVYMYPSHDIHAPEGVRQDWFCMADYHVFSSEDLVNWHDHGIIATQESVPWVNPTGYSMWAPDCVEKNGKYYFYFPAGPKGGRGFGIGVGVADRPEGPFVFEEKPIEGIFGIDPCVLNDDDGKSYIYWGGVSGAPLKDNMKELADKARRMEGLPDGFKEGPFAFKKDGHYYLTFPWVRKEGGTEVLAYCMSDKPLGPWEYKGIIMKESSTGCWTNHHSIVQYRGEWYLFYHHNDYSPNFDKRRSVRIDRLYFNEDGTIREVIPTLRGVGISKADSRIDVDRYSSADKSVELAYLDTTNTFRGWEIRLPKKSSWLTYNDVDFSNIGGRAYLTANVKADKNTRIVIREKGKSGKVIARIDVQVETDGQRRRNYSGQWFAVTAPLTYIPKGVTDLHIACEGEPVSIDWLQFKNHQKYFAAASATPAKPDSEGFIRRWSLLEPIDKPNRSNTVFTDSYLREHFNREYFPGQFTIVPKDGEKVKAGKQRLTWHKLDSERFNVKLFRFADGLQKQIYGVLFWAVTVIDCPEEIKDVRLAVGSNSASMWWLNGEEVLLLSGDRRMVKDDAVSPRITLKKGRNILRGAVINGPGMSDFCVRFIDEDEKPVTGFEIK